MMWNKIIVIYLFITFVYILTMCSQGVILQNTNNICFLSQKMSYTQTKLSFVKFPLYFLLELLMMY